MYFTFKVTRPAGAIFDLRERAIPLADQHRRWQPSDGPMPALFVSHSAYAGHHLDAFDEWAAHAIHAGDVDKLMAYMDKAPGARIAHSTADHYVPLLLTMGAADDPRTAKTVFTRRGLGNHIRSIPVA
ncbi:TPA: hypothetical protein I8V45_001104 [Corynebacterium striatum]|uniref:Uncharacterized protein n=2 Tax=Corynebacterium striatum TaxID=43770 RepID=A0ABC8CP93_CORST|nr:hypothetical protein BBR43_10735 [Corynebacterium striatum]ATZ09008.1 hypothetical protein A9D01_09855 [Corynebacterium striatum]HAT1134240.1 hypothetical protein [Corynebacterium striatum]HAT1157081.1 hypothetical protein [Corynebacterium striatum]HAT1159945.1 hypothetical protein [Corynebacterium striatum]